MLTGRTTRSWLYVPGDRPDRFGKAAGSGAHAVVLDLEDAVAPEAKEAARRSVAGWLSEPGHRAHVRINAAGGADHEADLAALAAAPGLLGVLLAKAAEPRQVAVTAAALPAAVPVLPLVESAAGVRDADALAAAPRVALLVFGGADFALDIGVEAGVRDESMLYARSRLVIASRAAGIGPPVDGVTTDLDDPAAAGADAAHARALGFGGKQCVHPRQVAAVNAAFAPTAREVAWARRVVAADADARGAALRLDGRMIDRPVVERARRIIDEAGG